MQLARSYNTKRNIVFGYLNKTIVSIIPFVIKGILIRKFGSEYLGLSGLFTSILQVLNLAELGLGTAIVWCMYQPIAENDEDEICAILNFYKRFYRIIGLVIFVAGMLCLPILDIIIQGDAPENVNVHFLFFLYLVNTVESYLLFAYKSTILNAFQRNDIISRIDTIVIISQSLTQIIILYLSDNYYLYFGICIVFTAINNILVSLAARKLFPNINCRGQISEKTLSLLKKRMYGLVIGKLSDVTRTSFDSIFATGLLGLTLTAVYNNYFAVINGVMGYFLIVLTSISSGVGNSIALDSVEKNYSDMLRMDFIYSKFFGLACVYLICLYQPFMQLWMGRDMVASDAVMISFVIYFYSKLSTSLESVYLSSLGLWWESRFYSVAEMIANIILNFCLGKCFGLIGIVLSTVISFWFISTPGSLYVVKKNYFKDGVREYIQIVLQNVVLTTGICMAVYLMVNLIKIENPYLIIVVRFLICTVTAPMMYWLVLHRTNRYRDIIAWIKPRIRSGNRNNKW